MGSFSPPKNQKASIPSSPTRYQMKQKGVQDEIDEFFKEEENEKEEGNEKNLIELRKEDDRLKPFRY